MSSSEDKRNTLDVGLVGLATLMLNENAIRWGSNEMHNSVNNDVIVELEWAQGC